VKVKPKSLLSHSSATKTPQTRKPAPELLLKPSNKKTRKNTMMFKSMSKKP